MDTALDYVGLAATTGLTTYFLAQLLSGGSANRQLYHGMTMATAVGIATGVGSMVAKMQAGSYSCKNLTLEMDLTNTLAAAVQLVPVPILVDYIKISTGSGAILQTLYGEELWGYLAMTSNNVKMTGYQYITNTAPTTFQLAGTRAAGDSVTYNIPLLLSFLVQLDFFLGNLNDLGLTIQVYSRGPGPHPICMVHHVSERYWRWLLLP